MNGPRLAAVVLAACALAGCKDEKKVAAAPAAPASQNERLIAATEQNLRAAAWPNMQFRGVQIYTQAAAQHMAVCGQLSPFADDPGLYVPFVSIVTFPLNVDGTPQYQFDHRVGKSTAEASRVYVSIVDYCWDKGGPSAGPYRSVSTPPPLPDNVPDPAARNKPALTLRVTPNGPALPLPAQNASSTAATSAAAAATTTPTTPADATPASGTVTMHQAGNLHADPHGPSIRVIPQGTSMHVFGQAAGGWYQVGDTAPWGWMHESMFDRH